MSTLINEYKFNLGKQITWFVFLIIIVAMFMLAFPIVNDPSVQPIVESNLKDIPNNIKDVIFPVGVEAFGNLRLYFKTVLVFVSVMVSIYSLNIGLSSLAREQGYGTIEYVYINPITRTEILTYKFIANLLNLIFLVLLLLLSTSYAYSHVGELDLMEVIRSQIRNFAVIFFQGLLFLSLGTMISAFAKRTSGLGGIGSLIILALLIFNILISSNMIDVPGHIFIPLRTLQETYDFDITRLSMVLLIGSIVPSIALLLIGNIYYDRKDLIV